MELSIASDQKALKEIIPPSLVAAARRSLENLDWSSKEPEQLLWPLLAPAVRRTYRFWRRRARAHRIEPARFLRNIVATSNKADLELIRIVLRWTAARPELPESRIAEELLHEIPRRKTHIGLLEKLLFGDTSIRLTAIHDHGLGDKDLFYSLYQQYSIKDLFVGRKRLSKLIRRFKRWQLDHDTLHDAMSYFNLEPVNKAELATLPPATRNILVRTPDSRTSFLIKSLAAHINMAPADHAGTAEWEHYQSIQEGRREQEQSRKRQLRAIQQSLKQIDQAETGELKRLIAVARDNQETTLLVHLLQAALSRKHRKARAAIGEFLSEGDFRCDWSALSTQNPELRVPYLNTAAWDTPGRIVSCSAKSMPDGLLSSIELISFRKLVEIVRINPQVFAPLLISRKDASKALVYARKNKDIAAAIEDHVPQLQRWERLEVANDAATSPDHKAAYELGLAFSPRCISLLLRMARDRGRRRSALKDDESPFDGSYHTYLLPKKAGGTRTITAPTNALKYLQRRLMVNGFRHIKLAKAAHGFRPEHSILTNAETHVSRALVVNVDIHRFFDSTSRDLIFRATRELANGQLSTRARQFVTDICTYRGALPTGAPTSPYIGNIVLRRVDRAIETLCEPRNIAYSRYADDLTLSGGEEVKTLLPFVRQALRELGYTLDARKTQLYRRGRRQVVTGVVVNDRANLPRRIRKNLRAAAHRHSHGETPHWHSKPLSDAALRGHLAYWRMFDPERAPVIDSLSANVPPRTPDSSDD